MDKGRIKAIDGLRGITICIIAFIYHYQHFTNAGVPYLERFFGPFFHFGWLGCEMFFMLSGFVMAMGYKNRIAEGEISFFTYFSKRIKRIYPVMLFTTVAVALEQLFIVKLTGNTFVYPNLNVKAFLRNVFLVQYGWINEEFSFNAPSWCISVIIFCYIIFWFAIKKAGKNNHRYIYVIIIFTAWLVYERRPNLPMINYAMARGVVCFFIGCLVYELYEIRDRLHTELMSVAGAACFILFQFVTFRMKSGIPVIFILLVAPMLIWTSVNGKITGRILSFRPLVALGKCSMSIYLWHFPVQALLKLIGLARGREFDYLSAPFVLCYICLTLAISILSYFLLEKKEYFWSILKKVFVKC